MLALRVVQRRRAGCHGLRAMSWLTGGACRFVCYTDVRIASPPETLIKWAFHVAMPWVYRVSPPGQIES